MATTQFLENSNGTRDLIMRFSLEDLHNLTLDTIHGLNKELAEKLADDIFRRNKKKIIASVNIDLITEEIQKSLLEKIKRNYHSKTK